MLKNFHTRAGKDAYLREKVDPQIREHILQKFPKILCDDEVYGSPVKKAKRVKKEESRE